MAEVEPTIEELMNDEIMDLLLQADGVKRSCVWRVVGQARRASPDGDAPVGSGAETRARIPAPGGSARA